MSDKSILRLGFSDTFDTAIRFFTENLSKRYEIIRDDMNPDYLIFGDGNFGYKHKTITNCTKIFYTGENCRPNYSECDFALTFDHENSPRHYRLPLYVLDQHVMVYENWTTDPNYLINNKFDPDEEFKLKTRFCTYIQSNPRCHERTMFFNFLNEKSQVDAGGPHLNNIGYVLPREGMHHKIDFMRTRKFNMAFENGSYPGYATEKILNAFYAHTIPIYWGSPTIARDFNPKAFINCHEYDSLDAIWNAIEKLMTNDNAYIDMLCEPAFNGDRPNSYSNITNFLDWFDTFVYKETL